MKILKIKKVQYPEKTVVNLVQKDKNGSSPVRVAAVGAIALVVILLFSYFFVFTRLADAFEAERKAAELEERIAEMQARNNDYNDVLKEYHHYYAEPVQVETAETADCTKIMNLIEGQLMSRAGVAAFDFSGATLTVQLTGTDLTRASVIIRDLKRMPIVDSVSVTTAGTQNTGGSSVVYMTINLVVEDGDEQ